MQRLWIQFMKFGIVGIVATLMDMSVYGVCLQLGVHYQWANAIGFVVSLIFNYVASMTFVFESKYDKHERYKEGAVFVVLSLAGFGWSAVLLNLFIDRWHWHSLVSKVLVTAVVIVWNFASRKMFLEKK